MTGEKTHRGDGRATSSGDGRSPSPRPIADGGPSRSAFFRAFPDPLLSYDVESGAPTVRAVNPAFERTFEVDRETVAGDLLTDHLLGDGVAVDAGPTEGDRLQRPNHGTEHEGAEATADAVLSRLKEGERLTLVTSRGEGDESRHFRLEAVEAPGDTAERFLVHTEVTDLRRRALDLELRADRLERFMGVAAHDVRNPLDVAKIRLEAARDTGEGVHFEKAQAALERIQHIIRDVLSVGGSDVDPSGGTALETVAEAAWSSVDTADATLVLGDDLSTIEADADRLQQIFENLFRNAVEHGGRGVTVTVARLPDGFCVTDDGPGIPPSERERAFEPGYSTADENTGLGLAIVRQIAEAHSWQVELTSADSGGARFEFVGIEADGNT